MADPSLPWSPPAGICCLTAPRCTTWRRTLTSCETDVFFFLPPTRSCCINLAQMTRRRRRCPISLSWENVIKHSAGTWRCWVLTHNRKGGGGWVCGKICHHIFNSGVYRIKGTSCASGSRRFIICMDRRQNSFAGSQSIFVGYLNKSIPCGRWWNRHRNGRVGRNGCRRRGTLLSCL